MALTPPSYAPNLLAPSSWDSKVDGCSSRLSASHRCWRPHPPIPVSGTPGEGDRGLREVIDAGAQMLLLNPVGPDVAQHREQMERLAAEVIPQLSRSQLGD